MREQPHDARLAGVAENRSERSECLRLQLLDPLQHGTSVIPAVFDPH